MKRLIRSLYGHLPLKGKLFSLLRLARPPFRIYQHLHFTGEITVPVDGQSFRMMHYGYQIENALFWAGIHAEWERVSLPLWAKLARESQVIFDLGANTGHYSLVAKTVNPTAQVYAFEPVAAIYDKLARNCKLNDFDIHAERLAVSDQDGETVIHLSSTEHAYAASLNRDHFDEYEGQMKEERIQTRKLSTYVAEKGIPRVDLLKIDVEAFEPQVLKGMGDLLARFKPTLLIEVLNDQAGSEIETILGGLGYLYFDLDEVKGAKLTPHIRKSAQFNYLVCQPEIARKMGLADSAPL